MLGVVLDTLHEASYVSPRDCEAETTTDEETEVQRGEMTCLRAQSNQEADMGFKLGQLDSRAGALDHRLPNHTCG